MPTGWIQNVNFYVAGVLIVVFALSLHRAMLPTQWGSTGLALLGLGGVGVVLAGNLTRGSNGWVLQQPPVST